MEIMRSFVVELRDDAVKFFEVEAFVGTCFVVHVSAMHHFKQIVIIDSVVKLLGNSLKFVKINCSILILVEKSKHSF